MSTCISIRVNVNLKNKGWQFFSKIAFNERAHGRSGTAVDEGDNYLIELAIAGNAEILVTHNIKDFQQSQLKFPQLQIKQQS